MSCHKEDNFYDIELLNKANLPIDRLIQYISSGNMHRIRLLVNPNPIWKNFSNVTLNLVQTFENQAYAHVKHVKENISQYGYLYFISENNSEWFNAAHFEYEQFPLMTEKGKVLCAIRKIAQRLSTPGTHEFDATCLYLLYFYGLLANPHSNWITMDYLTNGNKHHQYGLKLEGKLIQSFQQKWI